MFVVLSSCQSHCESLPNLKKNKFSGHSNFVLQTIDMQCVAQQANPPRYCIYRTVLEHLVCSLNRTVFGDIQTHRPTDKHSVTPMKTVPTSRY